MEEAPIKRGLSVVQPEGQLYGQSKTFQSSIAHGYRDLYRQRRQSGDATRTPGASPKRATSKQSSPRSPTSDEADSFTSPLSEGGPSPLTSGKGPSIAKVPRSRRGIPHITIDEVEKKRGNIHLQSADLFEHFSPVQKERQLWEPTLPDAFTHEGTALEEKAPELVGLEQRDGDELKALHPITYGRPYLDITARIGASLASPSTTSEECTPRTPETGGDQRKALRIGLILSGGPAPGGHNVIAGVYDYIKGQHDQSQLFGFMAGLDGLFSSNYRLVSDEMMGHFRNQGGFDMLWSGRGRVNGSHDLHQAKMVCQSLELHGLIIVGGDGSNSNAALLSEYFAENLPQCAVIGVPKTIDGDLRNPCLETSFGFDTAAKTYSELIGNLCTDITSSKRVYHFVRVMGRSASHLVLECALQTRPNLVYIGEEVQSKKISLRQIIDEISDLIIRRKNEGKEYGVVLVPEGLIEFIPEMDTLINELNVLLANNDSPDEAPSPGKIFDSSRLTTDSRAVWSFLPEQIRDQLLSDREATGYIQVAKIATERLLITMTENAIVKRGLDVDEIDFMPHYFGYEGRCAMPTNFDSNYCCALGYTAACLIHHNKTGYMAVVRHLDQHPTMWQPAGIPFTSVMEMIRSSDGATFPGVIRQLVDLKGPLFNVLCEVREHWKHNDVYRVPGPIQFEGPVADVSDYTVCVPKANELIKGSPMSETMVNNFITTMSMREDGQQALINYPKVLSELQLRRLNVRPTIPEICVDPKSRAQTGVQHLPKDPYTKRQTLALYPYLCNSNHFHLSEILHDRHTPPVDPGLRVGIIFLSRQSPGCLNIIWGLLERLKIVKGTCIGFMGLDGLLSGKYIQIDDEIMKLFCNQGGVALLGRSVSHTLLHQETQSKAADTCERLKLDGLVVVGSCLAMTEATLLTEYCLQRHHRTAIVAVPATSSGDAIGPLVEMTVGFDTSSKVYANLIGNVLTEAASMPKYWHFVRLMGRAPSNEVLECALQTHPSFVIIAEEYGAAGKTLADVVNDIADVVCRRAEKGKNFGTVLIPDGLLTHLPSMKNLMNEVSVAIKTAQTDGTLHEFQESMITLTYGTNPGSSVADQIAAACARWNITPWSMALFKTLPKFIRRDLVQVEMGEMRFTVVETELLLAEMVKKELHHRKKMKAYDGKFAAVTHFFGYQGRSSMPSLFDAQLGFAYGHLASICVESGLTGHCCTIRGLVESPSDWRLGAVPFNSLVAVIPAQHDVHPDLQKSNTRQMPIIPTSEVSLNCKAYRWMKTAVEQWQMQDRFCNPGPVQFEGAAASFYNRILHEEQADYSRMLRNVRMFTSILTDTCSFGVDEEFLRVAFTNLHSLLLLRFYPDDLLNMSQLRMDVEEYHRAQTNEGHRPDVWQSDPAGAKGGLLGVIRERVSKEYGQRSLSALVVASKRHSSSTVVGEKRSSAEVSRTSVGGGARHY